MEQVAKSCPSNLTGADVSVLCADAYSIAQREHIAKLHELAEGLRVQISGMTCSFDLSRKCAVENSLDIGSRCGHVLFFDTMTRLSPATCHRTVPRNLH